MKVQRNYFVMVGSVFFIISFLYFSVFHDLLLLECITITFRKSQHIKPISKAIYVWKLSFYSQETEVM